MGDIGLTWDATTGLCDISFAKGDVVLDASPVTPLLMSLFCDQRAHPGDVLLAAPSAPTTLLLNPRRGWAGDALDPQGRRVGSRLWVLERAVQDQRTLALARSMIAAAISWLQTTRGIPLTVQVAWIARGILGFQVQAGAVTLGLTQQVG